MKFTIWDIGNKKIKYIKQEDILNELELEINDSEMKDLSPREQARVETLREVRGWIK